MSCDLALRVIRTIDLLEAVETDLATVERQVSAPLSEAGNVAEIRLMLVAAGTDCRRLSMRIDQLLGELIATGETIVREGRR